jgi:uncharacterized delta-60 repeat protein
MTKTGRYDCSMGASEARVSLLAVALLGTAGWIGCPGTACASVGDLDPDFGDFGRRSFEGSGPVWAVNSLDDARVRVVGGATGLSRSIDDSRAQYWATRGFDGYLAGPWTSIETLANTAYLHGAVQADGKFVGVGRVANSGFSATPIHGRGLVTRWNPDGSADTSFNGSGHLEIAEDADVSLTSVAIDADGRIVVAGYHDGELLVRRFMPDGTDDSSFHSDAAAGIAADGHTKLIRAGAAGYRVLVRKASGASTGCGVLALQPDGTVDDTWGSAGLAGLGPAAATMDCMAMMRTRDGHTVVVGSADGKASVVSLTPAGQFDPGFESVGLDDATAATAVLAPDGEDRIYVAALAPEGIAAARVLRLMPDGSRDHLFGDSGQTLIDFGGPYAGTVRPAALDLTARKELLVAGGLGSGLFTTPFVVRLLGTAGNSPGIVGIERTTVKAAEGSIAVITVRRMGGGAGDVSITYRAPALDAWEGDAVAEDDYAAIDGVLRWSDGDRSDRTIEIPIRADASSIGEYAESFNVELYGAVGAGLGTRLARVTIPPDGSEAGMLEITGIPGTLLESDGHGCVLINRKFGTHGAVSVTVTPVSGTASAGEDFASTPIVVSWEDGDGSRRCADIAVVDDDESEPEESFTVELTNATGGAVVGPHYKYTIPIAASDIVSSPSSSPGGGGGGGGGAGSAGWSLLALLLLAKRTKRLTQVKG